MNLLLSKKERKAFDEALPATLIGRAEQKSGELSLSSTQTVMAVSQCREPAWRKSGAICSQTRNRIRVCKTSHKQEGFGSDGRRSGSGQNVG